MDPLIRRVARIARDALLTAARHARTPTAAPRSAPTNRREPGGATPREVPRQPSALPDFDYAPHRDGDPDPGEVVWTWVPYEDDPTRGKDRPVLVLARAGADVVVVQLSSQDHDRDAADEARWGRYWMDIGAGDWDSQRRPSEVGPARGWGPRRGDLPRGRVTDAGAPRRDVSHGSEVGPVTGSPSPALLVGSSVGFLLGRAGTKSAASHRHPHATVSRC